MRFLIFVCPSPRPKFQSDCRLRMKPIWIWLTSNWLNDFFNFFNPPKNTHNRVFFYLARHVVATHLEHLQLVPNLLKLFGTPSTVFAQLG